MVQILPQINTIIYTKKLLGGDYMKDMVKISNLNQTFYTKDGELEVLKNINFNLMEGQILTILGPSGSGKSTILNILTNLLKPTSGDVILQISATSFTDNPNSNLDFLSLCPKVFSLSSGVVKSV
jgi:ABC-type dipeptide/oligopeptide/nickel transport system ATPase subunit